MTIQEKFLDAKKFVLIDPTSPGSESVLGLLEPRDTHVSLVLLLRGPPSQAVADYAHAEDIDPFSAGSIYLDQLALRIADDERLVETILSSGADAAKELDDLSRLQRPAGCSFLAR